MRRTLSVVCMILASFWFILLSQAAFFLGIAAITISLRGENSPEVAGALVQLKVTTVESVCLVEDVCVTDEVTVTGSGAVIGSMTILTAGHVCDAAAEVSDITATDFSGRVHDVVDARISRSSDVCIIKTIDDLGTPALDVAQAEPDLGARIYSVGAPLGIFYPGSALTFDGIYSGEIGNGDIITTVPARPGSSGSPLVNSGGEIIGVIYATPNEMENVSVAVGVGPINELLVDDCDVTFSLECLK